MCRTGLFSHPNNPSHPLNPTSTFQQYCLGHDAACTWLKKQKSNRKAKRKAKSKLSRFSKFYALVANSTAAPSSTLIWFRVCIKRLKSDLPKSELRGGKGEEGGSSSRLIKALMSLHRYLLSGWARWRFSSSFLPKAHKIDGFHLNFLQNSWAINWSTIMHD